jgi:hypothetical protein
MDTYKQLIEDISRIPIGRVKEDFTIATVAETFTEKFIQTFAKYLEQYGYVKKDEFAKEIIRDINNNFHKSNDGCFFIDAEDLINIERKYITNEGS